jgi:hypothetical protein
MFFKMYMPEIYVKNGMDLVLYQEGRGQIVLRVNLYSQCEQHFKR